MHTSRGRATGEPPGAPRRWCSRRPRASLAIERGEALLRPRVDDRVAAQDADHRAGAQSAERGLAGCGSLRSQAKQRGRELFGWQTAGAAQRLPASLGAWFPDSACRCTLPNVTSEGGVGSNRPQSRSFNVQSLGVVSNGGRAWPRQGRPKSRRLLACRVQFFFALAVFTFTPGHPPRPSAAASSTRDRLTTRAEGLLDTLKFLLRRNASARPATWSAGGGV